jgi:hypothetical protein
MIGKRFGKLVVVQKSNKLTKDGRKYWECVCDCGETVFALTHHFHESKKCNKCETEHKKIDNCTHGLSSKRLYHVWLNFRDRCENSLNKQYSGYGGRGITVCDEWRNDPTDFIKWAEGNGYKEGLQIDRIDNDGNYSPENCRFVTQHENLKNKGKYTNNTSGYKGVYALKYKSSIYFLAKQVVNGKQVYLGSYKTAMEAAKIRDKYVISNNLGLPLNFPNEKNL